MTKPVTIAANTTKVVEGPAAVERTRVVRTRRSLGTLVGDGWVLWVHVASRSDGAGAVLGVGVVLGAGGVLGVGAGAGSGGAGSG